jgi:hypothetical protein
MSHRDLFRHSNVDKGIHRHRQCGYLISLLFFQNKEVMLNIIMLHVLYAAMERGLTPLGNNMG